MSQFPIYDSLKKEMESHDSYILTEEQDKFIQEHVKELDITGREIFYSLIKKDEMNRAPNEVSFKQMKHGVRIDYKKLSVETKYILYIFLKRHEQKLADDSFSF